MSRSTRYRLAGRRLALALLAGLIIPAALIVLAGLAATALTGCERANPVSDDRVYDGRNVLPDTEILSGPSGLTGPMVAFTWQGTDPDGSVAGYGYALFLDDGMGGWIEVARQDSVGPDVTSVSFGPMAGLHRFEVWSIDNDGGLDPTPATREFTCNPVFTGPKLFVRSNRLRTQWFRGPAWHASHDVAIDVFEDEQFEFTWVAMAADYGGTVVGYSYAWDDTTAWTPFDINTTSFSVTPTLGDHSLYVAALDSFNCQTRARIRLEVVESSMDQYVLIVDDYDWREAQPLWGTDEMRDAFYDSLAAGFGLPSVQWDCPAAMIEPPPMTMMGEASTIIWYCDNDYTAIAGLYDPYTGPPYDRLAGYVRGGGNLILIGWEALSQIFGSPYPVSVSPADTTIAATFVRDCLHIGSADNTGYEANKLFPDRYGYCFHGAVPAGTGVPGPRIVDFEPMYIDSVGVGGWPEPGKWPMYTWIISNYTRCGLPGIEVLEVYQGTANDVHGIDAYINYTFAGATCSVISHGGADGGNVAYFGFPLYYLQTGPVIANFERLRDIFGEQKR